MNRRRHLVAGALVLAVLAMTLHPALSEASETKVNLTTSQLPDFKLTDQFNRRFDKQRLTGKWSFLFFGYTQCPDICPNTVNVLSRVAKDLNQDTAFAKDTQFIFVSVDTYRDNPTIMKNFLDYFTTDFIGIVGPTAEIVKLSEPLGVTHRRLKARHKVTGEKTYLVEHGADVVLLAPDTSIKARFTYPQNANGIAGFYRELRHLIEQDEADHRHLAIEK